MFGLLHAKEPFHDGSFTIFTEKPTRLTPFHVNDGTSFYLSETDERPWDDFLTNRYAKLEHSGLAVVAHPSEEEQQRDQGDENR